MYPDAVQKNQVTINTYVNLGRVDGHTVLIFLEKIFKLKNIFYCDLRIYNKTSRLHAKEMGPHGDLFIEKNLFFDIL